MQVSMSCPPMTDLVPCVLWKETAKDVVLPQQKVKEFFVFKQIKVIIPHSWVALTWFLSFTSASFDCVFIFLLKWCGNFSSDVSGNRELFQWQQILVFQYCITAAQCWLLARDHDKWLEAPRGTLPPPYSHPPDTGKVLPQPSPVSPTSWNSPRPDALDSWHQDGKIYCYLDREKKQCDHILIISFILFRDLCFFFSFF